MQALKIEKLYLKHGGFLLRDFNMELEVGQIHVITGKSGSGKSTLFRAIGGALRPEAGRILYYGKEMYEDELKIRKRMSVIYDAPNFNMELSPERLVREWKKFEPWFDRKAFTSYMNRLELEMNQLWETTMNPDNRVIVQIKIEDAERADEAFSILMGEQVEPRKEFIERNAKYARLDV